MQVGGTRNEEWKEGRKRGEAEVEMSKDYEVADGRSSI